MKFCYNINSTLPKQCQRSRSVLQDGSRTFGLFWKEKTPSYNRRNTVHTFIRLLSDILDVRLGRLKESFLLLIQQLIFVITLAFLSQRAFHIIWPFKMEFYHLQYEHYKFQKKKCIVDNVMCTCRSVITCSWNHYYINNFIWHNVMIWVTATHDQAGLTPTKNL